MTEYTVAFLWDDPSHDRDSINAALTFMEVNVDARHIWTELQFIYENPDDDDNWFRHRFIQPGGRAYHRIANFIYNYKTDTYLSGILDTYIRFVPWHISSDNYNKHYRPVINLLLATYEELMEEDTDYNKFEKVYEKMATQPDQYLNYQQHEAFRYAQLDSITDIANKQMFYTFPYNSEPDLTFGSWGYSFWGRRYKEGIHKDVYYILQKISSKFPEE